jgi:hypothetical protein
MTYLTVVLSHLNPFSTIGSGFLKLWIQKYYKTSEKTLSKKYYRYILLFISIFIIRISKVLTISQYDDRILIYLGSFAPLLGGPPKYYEFLILLWSLNFIGFYFFSLNCNRNQYPWLEVFRFLDSYKNCKIVGIDNRDLTSELKIRAKIAFFISNHCTSVITLCGMLALIMIFYIKYELYDFLIYGIIWVIIWTVWIYYVSIVIYWFPSYYFIICYYLKRQLFILENDIKNIKSSRISISRKEALILRILENHHKICHKITIYNNYWQKYLSQSFMIFLTIICFLSYLYFFTPMPWLPKLEFSIVLLVHFSILIVLLYSSSSVSHFSITTYKLLQSIALEDFSIRSKLKVCITLNFYLFD